MSLSDEEFAKEEALGQEFMRLIFNCHRKRESLESRIRSNAKAKNMLTVTSGSLSLLSALTLTAIIVKNLSPETLAILALIFTFAGGVCALISTFVFNQREFLNLHLGASKFLELRERASIVAGDVELKYKSRKIRLAELQQEYTNLSSLYDHYVKEERDVPTSPVFQFGYEMAAKHLGRERVKDYERKVMDELNEELKKLTGET